MWGTESPHIALQPRAVPSDTFGTTPSRYSGTWTIRASLRFQARTSSLDGRSCGEGTRLPHTTRFLAQPPWVQTQHRIACILQSTLQSVSSTLGRSGRGHIQQHTRRAGGCLHVQDTQPPHTARLLLPSSRSPSHTPHTRPATHRPPTSAVRHTQAYTHTCRLTTASCADMRYAGMTMTPACSTIQPHTAHTPWCGCRGTIPRHTPCTSQSTRPVADSS